MKSPAIPRPTQQRVDASDDRRTFVAEVCGGKANPLPVIQDQVPITLKILLMYLRLAVDRTVILMNPAGPLDQQINPRHEATVLVEDLVLWLNGDFRCHV
jgi:hypothetical protein